MTTTPLAGRDARIYGLLLRVCRLVENEGIGTPADVRRVAEEHLPDPKTTRRAA